MLGFAEFTQPETVRARTGSVGSALKGIEARRPPLPGARWPSRREWPPTLWRPGNVVSPQRPIIMWHSPPATRNWVRFAYVTCYEMLRFSAFSRMEIRSLTQPRLFAMMNACQGNGGDGHA